MASSFEEKLEEILKYHLDEIRVPYAKKSILHLLDEEMPEGKEHIFGREAKCNCDEIHGWNSYRTELRKRLGI